MEQNKEYEYVDLGLPSGLKWAKCNIGAETETDYGDYFQWGSTEPNTDDERDLDNTLFNEWLDNNNNNLKPEFDAAYKATDGKAHMPTSAQFQELYDNTDNEWVENYNESGVNGWKFTSRINGNGIFFPAGGYSKGTVIKGQGSYCYYWSNSFRIYYSRFSFSLGLYLSDSRIYPQYEYYSRLYRFPVRPVIG